MGGYGGFLLLTKIVSTQCNKITYLFRKKWGIWTNYFHKCTLLNFSLFFHLSYKITIILIISKTFFRREFLYLASCCYFMVAIFLIWKQRGKRIFFSSLHHLFFSGPCLFILFWSLYFTLQTILSYLVMLDFSSYFWNHSCKAPWKLWVCGSQTWGDLLSVSVDLFSWKSKKKKKNLPAMQKKQVQSLGQEDPLEEGMATYSGILAWRIPWTEKPGGLQPMGLQRVRHDYVTNTCTLFHTPLGRVWFPRKDY